MISFQRSDRCVSRWYLVAVACCGVVMVGSIANAQRPKSPPTKKDAAEPAPKKSEPATREASSGAARADDERFKPQAVDVDTADGVLIAATYFPPVRPDKGTPVVVLLHGHGEKQSVFWPSGTDKDLAFALQDKGYAVLTLDFRGHGHSRSRVGGAAAVGQKAAAASGKLSLNDLGTPKMPYLTLLEDIEAAKRFLVRRNNAGEINVAKLGVVGCEMGASLAVLWSFRDWQYKPQVGFAATKQGEDVQALVLISPQYNFKGLSISKELAWLQPRVPIQVVVGKKDAKALGEAEKMVQSAKKALPAGTDSRLTDVDGVKIQGSRLLNPDEELEVEKEIVSFLDAALKKKPMKWESRDVGDDQKTDGP